MTAPIGVFDSGIGGLSVLKALRAELPLEDFIYIADSGHAPYGERDDAHVLARSRALTAHLVEKNVKALVIACNTATAAAINQLRADYPQLPIIGVEPALKPAALLSRQPLQDAAGLAGKPGGVCAAALRRPGRRH
jgi:glutamate racemase